MEIINILLNQKKERDELLSRNYVPRHTTFNTNDLLASKLIKLISGPRRAGKSTEALMMLKGRNFAYLNFDDEDLLASWDESLVMNILEDVYPNYEYLLLDEVQNLDHWDLWVSKLYRRGNNLIITGSNARMLSSEMATVLTGRYLQVEMYPFSLRETLAWNSIDYSLAENKEKMLAIADNYLRSGGYPETLSSKNIAGSYLSTLYDAMIWKDVSRRHNIRNTSALSNLAYYLLSNFCNPVTANDLAQELDFRSTTTVTKYMDYLHEPYLFFYLSRYNNKLRLMKKAAKKVYVIDNGFVTAKAFNIGENNGRLLENQVFIELLRRGCDTNKSIFYYKTRNDKEVDFVIREGAKVKHLIQVCYDLSSKKTEKREIDGLLECSEELHCQNLTIVTFNDERTIQKSDKTIQVVPIIIFSTSNEY